MIELDEPLTIDVDGEPSDSLRLATLVAHTAELLRGSSVVTERGVTLDSLLAEAAGSRRPRVSTAPARWSS